MAKDNTGVPQTCPLIDDLLNYIKGIEGEMNPKSDRNLFKDARGLCEEIRAANIKLREFGNQEWERAERLQNELNETKGLLFDIFLITNE